MLVYNLIMVVFLLVFTSGIFLSSINILVNIFICDREYLISNIFLLALFITILVVQFILFI